MAVRSNGYGAEAGQLSPVPQFERQLSCGRSCGGCTSGAGSMRSSRCPSPAPPVRSASAAAFPDFEGGDIARGCALDSADGATGGRSKRRALHRGAGSAQDGSARSAFPDYDASAAAAACGLVPSPSPPPPGLAQWQQQQSFSRSATYSRSDSREIDFQRDPRPAPRARCPSAPSTPVRRTSLDRRAMRAGLPHPADASVAVASLRVRSPTAGARSLFTAIDSDCESQCDDGEIADEEGSVKSGCSLPSPQDAAAAEERRREREKREWMMMQRQMMRQEHMQHQQQRQQQRQQQPAAAAAADAVSSDAAADSPAANPEAAFANTEDFTKAGGSDLHYVQMQATKPMEDQPKIASKLLPLDTKESSVLDVLVVGCGPAGLSIAAECAKRGLTVGLVAEMHPSVNNYGVWLDEFKGGKIFAALDHPAPGCQQAGVWYVEEEVESIEDNARLAAMKFAGGTVRYVEREAVSIEDDARSSTVAFEPTQQPHSPCYRIIPCSPYPPDASRLGVRYVEKAVESMDDDARSSSVACTRWVNHQQQSSTVACTDGSRTNSRLVVVAAGAASGKFLKYDNDTRGVGVQTAYGIEVELDSAYPYNPASMLFMDYRDLQRSREELAAEGELSQRPSFLYAMPPPPHGCSSRWEQQKVQLVPCLFKSDVMTSEGNAFYVSFYLVPCHEEQAEERVLPQRPSFLYAMPSTPTWVFFQAAKEKLSQRPSFLYAMPSAPPFSHSPFPPPQPAPPWVTGDVPGVPPCNAETCLASRPAMPFDMLPKLPSASPLLLPPSPLFPSTRSFSHNRRVPGETCLASRPAMPFDMLKTRLRSRLAQLGVKYTVTHEEVRAVSDRPLQSDCLIVVLRSCSDCSQLAQLGVKYTVTHEEVRAVIGRPLEWAALSLTPRSSTWAFPIPAYHAPALPHPYSLLPFAPPTRSGPTSLLRRLKSSPLRPTYQEWSYIPFETALSLRPTYQEWSYIPFETSQKFSPAPPTLVTSLTSGPTSLLRRLKSSPLRPTYQEWSYIPFETSQKFSPSPHLPEWSYIPVGGSLPLTTQQHLGFGAAASMIHPATGYSITRSLTEAPHYATALAAALRSPSRTSLEAATQGRLVLGAVELWGYRAWDHLWSAERKRQQSFMIFGLELILQLDAPATRDFFNAFFKLPP
ncbi:unnamed protein product, partial [Closterium sp. NIES-65]